MFYPKCLLISIIAIFCPLIVDAKPLSIKENSRSVDTLRNFTGIWLRSDFTARLIKHGSPRLANDFIPNIMSFQPCDELVDSCIRIFTHSEGENVMGSEMFHRVNDSIIFSHLVGYCYKMYFGTNGIELNCVLKSTAMRSKIEDTIVKYVKIGNVTCETQTSANRKLDRIINKTLFAGRWELLNLKTSEKQILVLNEEGKIQDWDKFDSYYPFTDYNNDKLNEPNKIIDLLSFRKDGVGKEQWFGYKHNGTTINLWNALDDTQTIIYQLERQ